MRLQQALLQSNINPSDVDRYLDEISAMEIQRPLVDTLLRELGCSGERHSALLIAIGKVVAMRQLLVNAGGGLIDEEWHEDAKFILAETKSINI